MYSREKTLLGCVVVFVAACGSGETGGGRGGSGSSTTKSGGGDEVSASNCGERCAARATDCGASEAMAAETCDELCSSSPSDAQLDCMEATPCAELAEAHEGLCGIGGVMMLSSS